MESGKVVLGILAGLAAGAALGIIFAPAKGTDTRKKICKQGEDCGDELKEKFNEFLDRIFDKFEQVKGEASEFAEQTKTNFENVKKDMKTDND